MTREEIKNEYDRLNEKYFEGRLPKNLEFGTEEWTRDLGHTGITYFEDDEPVEIDIISNEDSRFHNGPWTNTLLHEMVHISVGCDEDHGPIFQNECRRVEEMMEMNDEPGWELGIRGYGRMSASESGHTAESLMMEWDEAKGDEKAEAEVLNNLEVAELDGEDFARVYSYIYGIEIEYALA